MSALMAAMRRQLVGRFGVRKRGVELLLPFGIGGKADARLRLAARLQIEHVAGQVDRRRASAASFCRTQARPPILASVGRLFAAADVLLHQLDLRGRHVDLRAAVELELQVLFGLAFFLQQLQAAIAADAVRQVDHVIAFAQLEKAVDHAPQAAPRWDASDRRGGTARCR